MGLSDDVHFTILLSLFKAQYRCVTDVRTDGRTGRCRKDRAMHSVAREKKTSFRVRRAGFQRDFVKLSNTQNLTENRSLPYY